MRAICLYLVFLKIFYGICLQGKEWNPAESVIVCGHHWLKLIEIDWNWLKLIETDWNWLKLIEIEWNWLKLIETDWNWLKLIENDWNRNRKRK